MVQGRDPHCVCPLFLAKLSALTPLTASASIAFTTPDWESIDAIYNDLGPTPRLCIELHESDSVASYSRALQESILKLDAKRLSDMILGSSSLSLDEVSSRICLIARKDPGVIYDDVDVSPITTAVATQLVAHLRTFDPQELLSLYMLFIVPSNGHDLCPPGFYDAIHLVVTKM